MALVKHNLAAVIQGTDSPVPPPAHESERIVKVPMRATVYAPPLVFVGDLHVPRSVDWLDAVNATRLEFIPMTRVKLLYLETRVLAESDLSLVLVNRAAIIGLEPM